MEEIGSRDESSTLRLVTFNVNGIKTIFNYHPWTESAGLLNHVLKQFNADVITFQELKLNKDTLASVRDIGHLQDFRSFISLPLTRKGYAGVGVFVANRCSVVAAEEGITGWLHDRTGIGGYPEISQKRGLELDAEGRGVVIELDRDLVIISVYCPANSMGTEEGELFRMDFLRCLLSRCHLLYKAGKKVILMGDINVSLNLIDHADTLAELQLAGVIGRLSPTFESQFTIQCADFTTLFPQRRLLNEYVKGGPPILTQFFIDTTRVIQKRRTKMYTVWNTQLLRREINHGLRIDLILATPELEVVDANIAAKVLGLDHCPVYTDFHWQWDDSEAIDSKLPFEAKRHFKLSKLQDISALFGRKRKMEVEVVKEKLQPTTKTKLEYVSRKQAKSETKLLITRFFQ